MKLTFNHYAEGIDRKEIWAWLSSLTEEQHANAAAVVLDERGFLRYDDKTEESKALAAWIGANGGQSSWVVWLRIAQSW